MSKSSQPVFILYVFFFFGFIFCPPVFANNFSVSNVTLEDRDADANTAIVEFDISWDNSWYTPTNHDAVWIILKVTKSSVTYHGMMKESGVNPKDTSAGSNKNLEVYVPSDKTGAFIRRKVAGTGTVSSTNVRLKLDYNSSPLSAADTDTLQVKIIGIEMVYIPTGEFRVGDTSSQASLKQGSADTDPWFISSEATIAVQNYLSDGYYYVTASETGEDITGTTFTLRATYPKGYAAFYCMKYEITEGQYVDFMNTLSTTEKDNRDITSSTNAGKNADSATNRNTISYTSGGTATTERPDRAVNYVAFYDLAAYLDWAALRPMTELEFEKAARGPLTSVSGEYAWGSTTLTYAAALSISPENGLEEVSTANANVVAGGQTYSGGDAFMGAGNTSGPLRVGIFATSSSTRQTSGAGYYGVMELSGNIEERVATIGNAAGRSFYGNHGDGILNTTAGFEGNANQTNWPGTNWSDPTKGVTPCDSGLTCGSGVGRRGAAYTDSTCATCPISFRGNSPDGYSGRHQVFGGRGVRTYDGP